jgi:hypothetical protein
MDSAVNFSKSEVEQWLKDEEAKRYPKVWLIFLCRMALKGMEGAPRPDGGAWVSIEECKPEAFREVLVYHVLGDQSRSPHAIDIAMLGKDGEWFFPWCDRLGKEEAAPVWVKAWAPLPQPPMNCDGDKR